MANEMPAATSRMAMRGLVNCARSRATGAARRAARMAFGPQPSRRRRASSPANPSDELSKRASASSTGSACQGTPSMLSSTTACLICLGV